MNQPGEIARLAALLKPELAVITNIYPAHLQGLGSLQAIAREKAALVDDVPPGGTVILNADDPFFSFLRQHAQGKMVLGTGFAPHADIRGFLEGQTLWAQTPQGEWRLSDTAGARHEALNMLLGFAVSRALQHLPPRQPAFEGWRGVPQRLTPRPGKKSTLILDDTYNANPGSLAAAIDVLAGYPGKKTLVFGDMGELGDEAPQWHRWAGEYAARAQIDVLWTAGDLSRWAHEAFVGEKRHFADVPGLLAAMDALLTEPSTMLVKASRAMRFEAIVAALAEAPCS
jgi:UDP-N-acetylmuramoyl-tripeptide--D-alanyl-D-alanine ligase